MATCGRGLGTAPHRGLPPRAQVVGTTQRILVFAGIAERVARQIVAGRAGARCGRGACVALGAIRVVAASLRLHGRQSRHRTDPSGVRFGYGAFQRDINRFFGRLGLGALGLSLLPGIGEVTFAVQLSANAGAYFPYPTGAVALAAGLAAELAIPAEGLRDVGTMASAGLGERLALERIAGSRAFGIRSGIDAAIGGTQSVLAGLAGGKRQRFDVGAFGESKAVTFAGQIGVGRLAVGIGYNPFTLTADDATRLARPVAFSDAGDGESERTLV